ncbi:MAG: VanZ family protein [candidate division Zixibacteria bacterium]|nr:VanZ family protein [candidate division Zixibacteria bacterium]
MPTKVLSYKYLALIYALLIFAISAIPELTPPSFGFKIEDKILHFLEYSVFSFLLFLAFFTSGKEFLKKHVFLISSLIGIAYALTDELHQKFVPGRSCDFFDFLADCLGIIAIQIGIWFYFKRKENRLTAP